MVRIGAALTAALSLMAGVSLAGCGNGAIADGNAEVDYVPCSQAECSGALPDGSQFEILMPEEWSGSLALFSHGMRMPPISETRTAPRSQRPTSDQPSPGGPEPAPRWGGGDNAVADAMLQAGYAVAGAAPGKDGWAVGSQVTAAEELYQYFVQHVGQPTRVYAWGEDTGGLASVRLAELHPEWVSGAAALCAPMSGPLPSYDLALDAGFAVRQLLLPESVIVGFSSAEQAEQTRAAAVAAVRAAAGSGKRGEATVLFIASLLHLPLQTDTEPGTTRDSQVAAAVQGISNLIDQNTRQRYLLEQLTGGNPSGNDNTDYDARIDAERRNQIDIVAPGTVARLYAKLGRGQRIAADQSAARAAAAQGEPIGDLKVPVLTLHNVADPEFITANESWYADRVGTFGPDIRANLVNAYALPPTGYSAAEPAPEGAGHCNLEARTVVGAVIQLDLWARKGLYPGRDSVGKAFADQQIDLDYSAPDWPDMGHSPTDAPIDPDPDEVYQPPQTGAPQAPTPVAGR